MQIIKRLPDLFLLPYFKVLGTFQGLSYVLRKFEAFVW